MTDHYEQHENLTKGQQKLVGLCQEMYLRQDETGGPDGMWFGKSVELVAADPCIALRRVVDFFKTTEEAVIKQCGF